MNKTYLLGALALLALPALVSADHPPEAMTTTHSSCHIEENLSLGSRSDAVSCLQIALIAAGHLEISAPTGYFGDMTKMAVMHWQEAAGVPATGYFGQLSRAAYAGGTMVHAEDSNASKMQESTQVAEAMHAHEPIDVAAWPTVPKVTLTLHSDSLAGFNAEITTENFAFAPQHVNGAVVPNEGHAHIYVDGKKHARVYGNWFHVPGELFAAHGTHTVVVTLNANDHSDLEYQGTRVEASQVVTTE